MFFNEIYLNYSGLIFSNYAAVSKIFDAVLINLLMEKLKDDPTIPPSVQDQFNSSFSKITQNIDWFKKHYKEINEWNVESCTEYV